ncbi:MAG: hypothetical protein CM15mP68_5700 [Pseudomonadota bacterium]|nr:MAG: hypothetical protein CM15mP68_5700 [Pseudomonadota bacterium]
MVHRGRKRATTCKHNPQHRPRHWALNKTIRAGDSLAQQQQQDIETTRKEINDLSEQVEEQTEGIAAHLQAAYRLGGDSFAKSLIQSRSPAEVDRMIRYHGYFSAQRIDLVEQYSATLSALEDAERTLNPATLPRGKPKVGNNAANSKENRNAIPTSQLTEAKHRKRRLERGCWQIASVAQLLQQLEPPWIWMAVH